MQKKKAKQPKPENAGEIQAIRNEKGQFLPGHSGNPAGKPPGTRNFLTDFEDAIRVIAASEGKDADEVRRVLVLQGYSQASRGNFSFWKEIIDRCYGKQPDQIIIPPGDSSFRDAPLQQEDAEKIDKAFEAVVAVQRTVVYNPENKPVLAETTTTGKTVSFQKPEPAPVKKLPSFGVLKRGANGEVLNELQ